MAAKGSVATPAIRVLERAGISYTVHPYNTPTSAALSYGLEAAKALQVAPEQVFKTLLAETDAGFVAGIVPVSGSLDLKALAKASRAKRAAMAEATDAERMTGYVTGGISPLGQRHQLPTVIDQTVETCDTVYVSAGRRGLQVELAPNDLIQLTGATLAPISGTA